MVDTHVCNLRGIGPVFSTHLLLFEERDIYIYTWYRSTTPLDGAKVRVND